MTIRRTISVALSGGRVGGTRREKITGVGSRVGRSRGKEVVEGLEGVAGAGGRGGGDRGGQGQESSSEDGLGEHFCGVCLEVVERRKFEDSDCKIDLRCWMREAENREWNRLHFICYLLLCWVLPINARMSVDRQSVMCNSTYAMW